MSKTWSKTYCSSDYSPGYTPFAKHAAAAKVRRAVDVPDGGAYKKLYCSWDIFDYKFIVFPRDRSYWNGAELLANMAEGHAYPYDMWEIRVELNYRKRDRFPRYGRRDRKRARNMKGSSGFRAALS